MNLYDEEELAKRVASMSEASWKELHTALRLAYDLDMEDMNKYSISIRGAAEMCPEPIKSVVKEMAEISIALLYAAKMGMLKPTRE